MMRQFLARPGFRPALTAGLAAMVVASGATWLAAGEGPARESGPPVRLAQAATPAPAEAAASPFDAKQKSAIDRSASGTRPCLA